MAKKKTERQFQELPLYVARKTESDPKCGRPKLYKILFYADFAAYQNYIGRSISGQNHQRLLPNGPAPKRALLVLEAMGRENLCVWAERDFHGHLQHKLLALREPDLALFSGE